MWKNSWKRRDIDFPNMIKLNLRWLVQACALVLSIASFTRIFNASKSLMGNFSTDQVLPFVLWVLLFLFSFFLLMFTSYLKQRGNFTLRHRLNSFEKLIYILHLEDYQERSGVSNAKAKKRAQGKPS